MNRRATYLVIGILLACVKLNFAQTVVIGQYPSAVPTGKKWILPTNKEILIEVKSSIMEGSMCDAALRSNPRIVTGVLKNESGHSMQMYIILFREMKKVAFTNGYTYKIIPLRIVNKIFQKLGRKK